MENKGRKIGSIVLVVLIAYFLLGLVGVLPAQYDVIRRAQGTQVEYGEMIEYEVPTGEGGIWGGQPMGITTDSDGNVWFTVFNDADYWSQIVKMTPNGEFSYYTIELMDAMPYPYDVKFDNAGNLWASILMSGMMKMTPEGAMTFYQAPVHYPNVDFQDSCRQFDIDSHGNVWFGEMQTAGADRLCMITPEGVITEYDIPSDAYAQGLCVDSNDNVWFSWNSANIGKMSPEGEFTSYPLSNDYIVSLFLGNDDRIYFCGMFNGVGMVGWITQSGAVTKYTRASFNPFYLTVNSNGDIWTDSPEYLEIMKTTSDGTFTAYTTTSITRMLTTDSSDNIWFAEFNTPKIGKMPALAPAPSPPPSTGEFAFTQVGQWTEEGDGRAPFEYVGEQIPITVEIDTNETVETASLLWQDVGESDWNFGDMSQGQDGAWRFSIPEQEREGTVYYQVQATTSEGAEIFSDTYGVQVLTTAETPEPSEPLVNPTVFYGVGTLLLVAVGVAINAPSKKWK